MSYPLALAFLFYVGAIGGWCIEFLFRNLISHKGPRGKYFINPGFCKGPWLPIYGLGLALMFLITWYVTSRITITAWWGHLLVIAAIAATMVGMELVGGLFLLKFLNLRLWDYRDRPGNFMGVICPLFTLIWASVGAAYYLLIHVHAINWLSWLSQNLAFSFFVGLFWGLFLVDLVSSGVDAAAIKKYGDDNDVVIKYEELKALIMEKEKEELGKHRFFVQGKVKNHGMKETLENAEDKLEKAEKAFEAKAKKVKVSK